MTPFRTLDAVAVPLAESNIDTDQMAPGRFLPLPLWPGLLLHDRRFTADGRPRPDFVLNDPAYAGAEIIVAQRNFGVGSSREYAARALPAAGFRCVIAVSFGDIFYNNCLQIGVLPIILDEAAIKELLGLLHGHPGMRIKVDLPAQTVAAAEREPYRFCISAVRKQCLLEGLDDMSLTDRYGDAVVAFEAEYRRSFPWLA